MNKSKTLITSFWILACICIGLIVGYYSPFEKPKVKTDKTNHNTSYISQKTRVKSAKAPDLPEQNIQYVRDVPLPLDNNTKTHIKNFGTSARKLVEAFPGCFYICSTNKSKKIALTFDDGPDNLSTLKIVDILEKYDAKATFFVTGKNVKLHPDVLNKILEKGHQVSNHSFSHSRPLYLTPDQLMEEIDRTDQILKKHNVSTNAGSQYFRPPYGLVNDEQMKTLKERNYKVITWSIDSMDWYFNEPKKIEECVIKNIHPGAIILMHSSGGKNGRSSTVKALRSIIVKLKNMGYELVTVHDLIIS